MTFKFKLIAILCCGCYSFVNMFLSRVHPDIICGTTIYVYNLRFTITFILFIFFYPRPKCVKLMYMDSNNIFTLHIVLRNLHVYEL